MANFPIVVDVMIKGLDEVKRLVEATDEAGRAFDEASEPLREWPGLGNKAGKASEEAGKKIKGAGKKAKGAGEEFEGAGKKAKGAGEGFEGAGKKAKGAGEKLKDAASQFRAMGSAGTLAGDSLERFSILTSGPVGFAIAGLVAGAASLKLAFDAVSASVSLYIDTNEEAARASDRLDVAMASLNESVIDLALGEGGLALITTNMARAAEDASEGLNAFRETADATSTTSETLRERIALARISLRNLGIGAGFAGLALDGLAESAIALSYDTDSLTNSNNTLISSFDKVVSAARRAGDAISSTVDEALVMLGLAESTTSKGMKVIAGKLAASPIGKRVASGVASLRKQLAPRRRGGGGRAKPADPNAGLIDPSAMQADAAIRAGGFASLAGLALQTGAGLAQKRKEDLDRVRAEEDAEQQRRLDKAKRDADALEAQAQQLGGTFFKVVATLQETMTQGFEIAKDSLAAATGEVANFFGAFAAGESTLSEFGDAMADLAANIANTFGDLFIKQGIGLALFNPGVGAALIAAGFALKMLGGAVASKGSANRGTGASTGSGASGAAASQAVAREVTRSLRPSGPGGENVTNIEVVIGGRSITPEMVAIVDDIARQRRSRYLGRRMGAF